MNDRQFLQSHALFGGFNHHQLAVVRRQLKQAHYAAGCWLFRQGDPGDRLFLIRQGRVEILGEKMGAAALRLAVRREGDSIGEMALIDVQNRSASARALTPVQVWTLSHRDLIDLYEEHPALFTLLILNIGREISRRLRNMNGLLSALFTKHCALEQPISGVSPVVDPGRLTGCRGVEHC